MVLISLENFRSWSVLVRSGLGLFPVLRLDLQTLEEGDHWQAGTIHKGCSEGRCWQLERLAVAGPFPFSFDWFALARWVILRLQHEQKQHRKDDHSVVFPVSQTRGAQDVKNCTGSVNFFKALGVTPLPPSPQKRICQTEKGNFRKKTYVQEWLKKKFRHVSIEFGVEYDCLWGAPSNLRT